MAEPAPSAIRLRWFAERCFACRRVAAREDTSSAAPATRSSCRPTSSLNLSTTLVAPTSTSARAASFRPAITLDERDTRVLVEQTTVVDPQRLGRSAGRLEAAELRAVDEALALVLGI